MILKKPDATGKSTPHRSGRVPWSGVLPPAFGLRGHQPMRRHPLPSGLSDHRVQVALRRRIRDVVQNPSVRNRTVGKTRHHRAYRETRLWRGRRSGMRRALAARNVRGGAGAGVRRTEPSQSHRRPIHPEFLGEKDGGYGARSARFKTSFETAPYAGFRKLRAFGCEEVLHHCQAERSDPNPILHDVARRKKGRYRRLTSMEACV